MSLQLVIHTPADPAGASAARAVLRDAVWEVAESHWPAGTDALLVASDLSPDYLLTHFRTSLARNGITEPGLLLVVPVTEAAAWAGLPAEAEAWMDEAM